MERLAVIGAGSWGTTIAHLLAEKGCAIDLWVYEPELADIIREKRENTYFLKGFKLSENIFPSSSIEKVVSAKNILVMVVPSQLYRSVAEKMVPFLKTDAVLVSATKGIENDTLLTMTGVWQEIVTGPKKLEVATLGGPSFAREVMQKIPTAVTVASSYPSLARKIQKIFSTSYFRVYTSTDKIGVELGGALKNVIALAAGITDGLGFGYNTRAALITRGLAETIRLGVKIGAQPLTFAGLSGIGDLILTCTGDLSRNRTVGLKLGQGQNLGEILKSMKMVAEGVATTKSVYNLAKKMEVEMPICSSVYSILFEKKKPIEALHELMDRELKAEVSENFTPI